MRYHQSLDLCGRATGAASRKRPFPAASEREVARLRSSDQFKVVVNHEEQYSLVASDRPIPKGWTAVGTTGTETQCLKYIEEVWTDSRPPDWRTRVLRRI